jgi:hypothetical protein
MLKNKTTNLGLLNGENIMVTLPSVLLQIFKTCTGNITTISFLVKIVSADSGSSIGNTGFKVLTNNQEW